MKISVTVQNRAEAIGLDFIHAFIASSGKTGYKIIVYMPFVKYCYKGSVVYDMYRDDEFIKNELIKPQFTHGCEYKVVENHENNENIIIEIETARHEQKTVIFNLLSIEKFNTFLY